MIIPCMFILRILTASQIRTKLNENNNEKADRFINDDKWRYAFALGFREV